MEVFIYESLYVDEYFECYEEEMFLLLLEKMKIMVC